MLPLKVSKQATVRNISKEIHDFFSNNDYSQEILLDLSEVRFVQTPGALVYLAQFIYARHHRKQKTTIRLPISEKVMTILFTWRFFEVVEDLTGLDIFRFIEGKRTQFPLQKVSIGDKSFYLNINRDYFDKYYRQDQIRDLVKKGFFSLVCEPFNNESQKSWVLKKQCRTWSTEKLVTEVLQQNLLEDVRIGDRLSNTIIFESLTNAANHPHSDHFVIGAFYDFATEECPHCKNDVVIKADGICPSCYRHRDLAEGEFSGKYDYFTIVMWDDGDSIVKTLSDSIEAGIIIRASESFEMAKTSGYRSWVRLIKNDYTNVSSKEFLYYDYLPDKSSCKDEILTSSFLPGVSRLPIPKNHHGDKSADDSLPHDIEKIDNVSTFSGTGMGLTYLMKSVVKDLNGSIHVRTDDYLLELNRARKAGGIQYNDMFYFKQLPEKDVKEVDYYCKAELNFYKPNDDKFMGNMISIKIPLKRHVQ